MKFKIKQNILMEHLNYVIKGVSTKNLIPILNCIKFELKEDGLYLLSTDNDLAIKTFIKREKIESIESVGSVVISGKYIYDIIKKLPSTIINIEEVVDSRIYIYTEQSSFYLNCSVASEFPNIEFEDHKNPVFLSKKVLKTIYFQTSFATSTQETRPVLTGINFKITSDLLECTATDSYRLSKKIVKLKSPAFEDVNVIIPTKNISELIKMFDSEENDVELHIFNNKIIFKFDSIIFMSSLINGTYPDTSKLIPTSFEIQLTTKLQEFFEAIDRASLLTNESEKNTIKFETEGEEATISSNIPEIGNVKEKIYINNINGKDIHIAFSSKYMMDAIKSFDGEEVQLLFNGETLPIIVKNVNNDDLIQLILPIRTY